MNGIGYFPSLDMKHGFSWKSWGNMSEKWEPDATKYLVEKRISDFLLVLEMNLQKDGVTIDGDGDECFDIEKESVKDILGKIVNADSAFTTISGIPVMQKPADCTVSIFSAMTHDRKKVIGLSHSGRDQISKKRPTKHIKHLVEKYGCDVANIKIGITPSLLSEHHIIQFKDADRVLGDLNKWGKFVTKNENEKVFHVDSLGFILKQYIDCGILSENIFAYSVDTYSSAKKGIGFSHRYAIANNAPNGRFLVAIQL